LSLYHPVIVLFFSQMELNLYDDAQDCLRLLTERFGADQGVAAQLQQLQLQLNMKRQQSMPADTSR
jgi:hypothetical protein